MPNLLEQRTGAMRRFNRFYTRQIGVLRKNYLDSPYSLGEMRVLYELAQASKLGGATTASDIGRALDLDAGYLSSSTTTSACRSPEPSTTRCASPDR